MVSPDQIRPPIEEFLSSGFCRLPIALSDDQLEALSIEVDSLIAGGRKASSIRKGSEAYAVRNVLDDCDSLFRILGSASVFKILEALANKPVYAVRAIVFDKPFRTNWFVPWDQDVTIAVQERVSHEGFTNWTRKAEAPHVRPPLSILESMLTLRIHLDDTTEENGALRVRPGSHTRGFLSAGDITAMGAPDEHVCEIPAGGMMVMRPLLLHSSRASEISGHRRVLHIEFSPDVLPAPIQWRWRIEAGGSGG